MTETEWLACDDPARMLGFLRRKTSDRKLRLFACGCCRQLLPWNENSRVVEALARAERYADGELADGTIEKWNQEVNRIESALLRSMGGGGSAQTTICWAVSTVCLPKRYSGFLHVWESLAKHASLFGEEFSTKGPALVR